MTRNDTETLIQKYLNGETTAEEERLLALEVSREDAPEDWKIIAEMLGELTVDEALFDKEMAERKQKPRILKLWPWVAAACVAALLIVFLAPPRDGNWSFRNPEISRLENQTTKQPNNQTTKQPNNQTTKRPNDQTTNPQTMVAEVKKTNHRASVSKGMKTGHSGNQTTKHPNNHTTKQPDDQTTKHTLTKVEESDIVPFDDPMIQFAEQARALRERGNRVIQRVSMNTLPPNNNPLSNI